MRSNRSRGGAPSFLPHRAPLGDQHRDEFGPALAEARAGKIHRGRPGHRQQHVEEIGPPEPRAVFHDEVAQGRAVTVHAEREHRAPGDLQRHALHRLAQIDRLACSRVELCDGLVEHRGHMRDEICSRTRCEGRRERTALMRPGVAFRDQESFAEHRTQHADPRRRARVIFIIAEQDMPDCVRLIQDEAVVEEKAALDDLFFIGTLPPGCDHVLLEDRDPAEKRHIVGRTRRGRRDDGPTHTGDVHGSLPQM
ncbi:hypothetical protein ABIF20_007810 [Bradyrhizobium japonicum]